MTKLEEIVRVVLPAFEHIPDKEYRVTIATCWTRAVVEALRDVKRFRGHEGIHFNCCTCGGHEEGWHNICDAILNEKETT